MPELDQGRMPARDPMLDYAAPFLLCSKSCVFFTKIFTTFNCQLRLHKTLKSQEKRGFLSKNALTPIKMRLFVHDV